MRITFPIRHLRLGKFGGVETYARALVSNLQRIDHVNDYTIFCSALNEEAFPVTSSNFKKTVLGGSKARERLNEKIAETLGPVPGRMIDSVGSAIRGLKRTAASNTTAAEDCYDIVHYMFNIISPCEVKGSATAITIVDIQHEYHPEFFSREELEFRGKYYAPSAQKADHIIAISDFTKKTIVEKYGVRPEKVAVVHLGYDADSFRPFKREEIEAFRKKYGLPESFLLYPAATWPHKNHVNLVRAYKILKDKYCFKGSLVLNGIKKENSGKMEEEIGALGLEKDIIRLGYLPYAELPLLYNAASIMVFPSLFEGFGIPVVEAFGSGLPVACSNATSLPEVAGDAALLFDPNEPEEIAGKVHAILKDQELRAELVERGLRRAGDFTWKRTAEETLRVYEKIHLERKR